MQLLYRTRFTRRIILIIENAVFNSIYRKILGNKAEIFGFPIITYVKNANFNVGKKLRLISNSYFSPMGVNHPVIIRLLSENAKLTIGDYVGLNGAAINVMKEITIGSEVLIGNNVTISDTDYHPVNPKNRRFNKNDVHCKPIVIEDNVFIGKDTIFLKGVTIGKNSIVGAASLVSKSIPPNEIWGGNPARFIRKLEYSS